MLSSKSYEIYVDKSGITHMFIIFGRMFSSRVTLIFLLRSRQVVRSLIIEEKVT